MVFYSLINQETEDLLADIIEFENGQYVGYFYLSQALYVFIDREDLNDFIKCDRFLEGLNIELIKEGVEEIIN